MNTRQVKRHLADQGFRFDREVRHGEIWVDGFGGRIQVNMHLNGSDQRAIWNILGDVKRAVRNRESSMEFKAKLGEIAKAQSQSNGLAKTVVVGQSAQGGDRKIMVPASSVKEEKRTPRRRFDNATRFKLQQKMLELYQPGMTAGMITVLLDQAGFTMSDGSPMELLVVRKYMSDLQDQLGKKAMKAPKAEKPIKVEAAPVAQQAAAFVSKLPDTVMSILTDPVLSDKQKVRMIAAYAEV